MRKFVHLPVHLALICLGSAAVIAFRDQFDNNYKIGHSGQFPYVAYLENEDSFRCGSTIIREDIVLTASYCVIGKDPSKMRVRAGGVTSNGITQTINVRDFHVHLRNGTETDSCDIALVKLDGALQWGEKVQYVDLEQKHDTFEGQVATALFWVGAGASKQLQKVPFEIISSKNCSVTTTLNSEDKICGNDYSRVMEVISKGSSGGPLILNANLSYMMHKQIGVICESEVSTSTSTFASVPSLRLWIDTMLQTIYKIESSSEEEEDNFIN